MIWPLQSGRREPQRSCAGAFERILQQDGNIPSEYGQSADWEVPAGDYAISGLLFSPKISDSPYHCGSVIAVSASGGRKTTCDPGSSTGTLSEVVSVET